MSLMKLFSIGLFLTVLSNSAFAMDPFEHEIMMGKIDAAELVTATETVTKDSNALLVDAKILQKAIGLESVDSEGKISALGQLITIIEKSKEEINSMEDVRTLIEMNQSLKDLMTLIK